MKTVHLKGVQLLLRQKMKKAIYLLLFLPILAAYSTKAQDPMAVANQELRYLFQHIGNPHPNVRFFYDLSAHVVDSALFNDNATDTIYSPAWYSLYKEMWWMAYDTNAYQRVTAVVSQANSFVANDVIPIGIMDWDYNLLKSDALTTGTYFNFDTVNNVLYDKPGAPNPFTIEATFAASPLAVSYPYLNPTFSVRPQFIFKDPSKGYDHGANTGTRLRINFSDGTGWHYFEGDTIENYVAAYTTMGKKIIRTQVVDQLNNVLKQSISSFMIMTGNTISPPDSIINITGLTANIYNPPGCTPGADRKYVIYLEGFDMLNNRSAATVYRQMILRDQIVQLKNQGYSFVVVNWNDATIDLRDNAGYLKGLIEALKCEYVNSGTDPHPFVIIGESMGGLIARYTLCDMERPNLREACPFPGGDYPSHNTRLLITFDAPHQGANVPLSIQYVYSNIGSTALAALQLAPMAYVEFSDLFTGLNSTAAKQMLKYHVATDPFYPLPVSIAPITQHHLKTEFDADLQSIGNYPQFVKLVALSNGSWVGTHQQEPYGTRDPREPNDHILKFEAETGLRILGIRIVGAAIDFDARTNPDGSGTVLKTRAGVSHWKIKLRWFGIRLVWHTDYVTTMNKAVDDVKPYCVMPGSNLGLDHLTPGVDSFDFSSNGFSNFHSAFGWARSSSGNGDLSFSTYFGSNFLSQLYVDFTAFSNGADFSFVPVYSSFDYDDQSLPLDQPLLFNPVPINDILNRTPFDVVITNPDSNKIHLFVHNPELGVYQSCLDPQSSSRMHSYLINREIGDDTLWLENYNAAYAGIIEAERDILINHRNTYYNYENDFSVHTTLFSADNFPTEYTPEIGAIVLSKQRSVNFMYSSALRSNDNITVNPAEPPTGSFSWTPGSMTNCCIRFSQRPGLEGEKPAKAIPLNGYMQLYPNPTSSHLTVRFQLGTKEPATLYVYNTMGQLVKTWQPKFADQTKHCYFNIAASELELPSGMYAIILKAGNEKYHSKLIIK